MGGCESKDADDNPPPQRQVEDTRKQAPENTNRSRKRRSITGPASKPRDRQRDQGDRPSRDRRNKRRDRDESYESERPSRDRKKKKKKSKKKRRDSSSEDSIQRMRREHEERQRERKAMKDRYRRDSDSESDTAEWVGKRGSVRVNTKKRVKEGVTDYIPLSTLETLYRVGVGEFGEVDCVRDKSNQRLYAKKAISKGIYYDLDILPKLFYEKECLLRIQSRYVIHLYSTMQDNQYCYFLLELVSGGEFHHHLLYYTKFELPWCQFYAANVVLAYEYMHSHKIVYRDMKPENLMIDEHGYIKIIDLGFAKILEKQDKTHTYCGTADYLAPEIINSSDDPDDPGHDYAVDWWGLGVLIYEMVIGRPPFRGSTPEDTFEKAISGKVKFPSFFRDKLTKKCIKAFLQQDPNDRLGYDPKKARKGVSALKKHPWFEELDWTALETQDAPAPWVPKANDLEKNAKAHDSGEKASFKEYNGEVDDMFRDF